MNLYETAADPFWNIISKGGALGVLCVVLWLILTGKLVPSVYYTAMIKDRDEWKEIARAGTKIVEKSVEKVASSS